MTPSQVFQLIAAGLVTVVLAGVALFGANLPLYMDALTLGVGGIAVLAWAHPKMPSPPVWGIAGLAGLAMLWAGVQGLPLPASWQGWVHPLWISAAAQLPGIQPSISLAPLDVWETLLHFTAYGLVFATAAGVAQRTSSARVMLVGLAFGGTLICLYGLIIYLAGNHYVLWLPKTAYADSLTGTFINRNTYATFAGIVILLNLSLYLHRIGEIPSPSHANLNQRLRMLVGLTAPHALWGVAALVVFITLVLSNSRAGLAATLVGLGVVWVCLYVQVKGIRPALWGLAVVGIVLVVTLVATIGPAVLQRMEGLEQDGAMRGKLFAFTYRLFTEVPWQGIGLGAFEETFRTVRDASISMEMASRIDHAHNSWLELLAEFGLPAAGLLMAAMLLLAWRYGQGVLVRRRGVIYPATGLGVLTLVVLHALADFSPNIPGFSLYTAAVLGALLAQSKRHDTATSEHPAMFQRAIAIGLASIAMVGGGWFLSADIRAYGAEQLVLARKLGEDVGLTEIQTARNGLAASLAIRPSASRFSDAALMDMLVARHLADTLGRNHPQTQQALEQAHINLLATLRYSPANPYAWYRLAQVRQRLNADAEGAAQALVMSLYTGPAEPNLAWSRLPMLMRYWPLLDENGQAFASHAVAQAWRGHPGRTWRAVSSLNGGPAWLAYALHQTQAENIGDKWQKVTRTPWPY